MAIILDGTNGITTPDLESAGPVTGTAATFSGNVTLGSSVLATPTGSAPSYTCRAWVNFNGTGTVAIRASGNVSSITDNGTGNYQVNFASALPDANYAVTGTTVWADNFPGNVSAVCIPDSYTPTTTATRIVTVTGNYVTGDARDSAFVNVAIFR